MSVPGRYIAALVAAVVAPAPALAERVAGAQLPDGATAVGPRRYRVEKSYEETLKYYKVVYPPSKYPRRPIANQPGVKAVHIVNPAAREGGWEGLNVYDIQGTTKVFVLVKPGKAEPLRAK